MRRLAAVAAALVLATACEADEPRAKEGRPSGSTTVTATAPTGSPVEVDTEPCPSKADLLAAPATGRKTLPDVELECIGEPGSPQRVSMAHVGRMPTVVNLWASWCGPCVAEMPDLEQVHRAAKGKVRFLGVNTNDNLDLARAQIAATGVTYPSVYDPEKSVLIGMGSTAMPSTFFVDAEGRVVHAHFGPIEQDRLRELMAEHLGVRL